MGESSAPIDMKLLKRLDRFDEFIRKSQGLNKQGTHLRLFANKLGKPVDDENLPLRLFPESLEGDALDWYSNLKLEDVKTWIDLSNAFVRQYEYNCELAPTRTTLEGTKRKPSEDHKTYAKRWRKVAAKVEPPMTEDEIIRTFIKAHDPPYFEEIFRMTGCSFAAIVNKLEEFDESWEDCQCLYPQISVGCFTRARKQCEKAAVQKEGGGRNLYVEPKPFA
ncbi:uncharacterized protein [Coffea arabica]|uniref:Uncharacterized protein LOC113705827 n=1 Tax=Coffea arabica TaxID=13443 RepID=A0A6P6U0F7_COFAR|nr:uncharacterized protein LOC113705827 [Coffea arabica]XP_027101013.1 uncharacterized protein LOC113720305 [Coffea arabica]